MPTIKEKIAMAQAKKYPNVIARLDSGWVVLHDDQPLPGYCVLIADPPVSSLNDLNKEQRATYCQDMIRIGDAILKVTQAYRINYETWCNLDQNLHSHIVPRYLSEPEVQRVQPACKAYDFSKMPKFDLAKDRKLIEQLREALGL